MLAWKDLDRILRGEATHVTNLKRGMIEVPATGISVVLVLLAMVYGVCMGCFAVFRGGGPSAWQLVATTLKVPALFVLTLLVTFPSLYVFNALVGSRLRMTSVLGLLIAALAVIVTVLASLGPIVAFFSVSTTSYHFMVLLNVVVYAVAGCLGMAFLLQTLHRLSLVRPEPPMTEATEQVGEEKAASTELAVPGALDHAADQILSKHVKVVFRCWIVLFALVGSQMGWVLRPFIGAPDRPFAWFRERDSNFFQAVWQALVGLLS